MGEFLGRFQPENIKAKTKRFAPRLALTAALSVAVPLHTPQVGAESQPEFSDYGIRLGQQRIGVVLLDLDSNPDPEGAERVYNILEGEERSPYSVEEYYHRASRGKIDFDFYVLGPYSVYAAGCNHDSIVEAGNGALVQNGRDLNQYDNMMYITEEVPESGCTYQGKTYQGGYKEATNTIVMYGNQQPSVIAHELAHGLELGHSHRVDCEKQQLTSKNCKLVELGDPTDIMGHPERQKMYYNFNAPHKIAMGFISEDEIETISESGTHTIIGSEINKEGIHVLKIKANDEMFGNDAYFFIEYRQPLPEFSESFASEFVVTAWTGNIDDPTYYLGSLHCGRNSCDSLELNSGSETVVATVLSEGEKEGKIKIEFSDTNNDGKAYQYY